MKHKMTQQVTCPHGHPANLYIMSDDGIELYCTIACDQCQMEQPFDSVYNPDIYR